MARHAHAPRRRGSLAGRRIVITGGPTREYLDAIRFMSNASTGRMGIELARVARDRGATVTLILGPTTLKPPARVQVMRVVSTNDLLLATRAAASRADAIVFSAAPSDFKPRRKRAGKPPREGGDATLVLRATPDVAATLGRRKGKRIHVGFALEVKDGIERAYDKLDSKNLDAIVLNGPENFGSGGGRALWIDTDGTRARLPTRDKTALARAIMKELRRLLTARDRSRR